MKVKDLTITATTVSARQGGLDNGKVYVNGAQIGSTKDLTEAGGITGWGFGSSFIVAAGTTAKVQVIADIKTSTSTSYANGNTVQVSVATTASGVQKMSSLGYQAAIAAVNGVAVTAGLTITAAGLAVSKTSGFNNQTIISGTNNVKLGSFVLTAGAAEGVNVSSVTVAFTTIAANSATVTNMYLADSAGVEIGSAKNVPGSSNIYSLSPNIALDANASKQIDLYANVIASSDIGSWVAEIDADGSGAVTGSAVSATEADIQTMTIADNGILTVVNGSMPDAAIVLAGSTGNYVAEYSFSAANEGFTVDKLKLKVGKSFATSTTAVSVSYTDKAGATRTSDKMFVASDSLSDATATFTGLTMYVPAGGDAKLKVYVSFTSASGATSGANSTISLDADEGFNATGDSGQGDTTLAASDLASNTFYIRKSKLTFAKLDAGTDPVAGAMYKFSVVADNAGTVEIKQLGFTVTTTTCDVSDMYLYDPSTSTVLTDTAVDLTTEGSSVRLVLGRAAAAAGTAGDDDIMSVSTTAKTYEVRGSVTGYSAAGDGITVRFKQDTTATSTAAAGTILATANGNYNVWSDRSVSAHTTATADWTNGYLLKDMTTAQSFSK